MAVTERHLTAEQFLQMPKDGHKYELVNGEAKEVPTGGLHGDIAIVIAVLLAPTAWKYGRVFDSSTGFYMQSGNIRCPDVSFMRRERLPDGVPPRGFIDGAPDLCVEIISPSEEALDSWAKIGEYFESGASQIWHVFPEARRVVVYKSLDDVHTYLADETVDGGELLPGVSFRVGEVLPA
ncbi:MAG TPA: Uma2 family endonuclease [Armatimonadota bacterium]|jgi:Uma2 family endonuclease